MDSEKKYEERETEFLQVRVKKQLGHDFGNICSEIGMSKSTCIRIFMMKMVAQRRQEPEIRHSTAIDQLDWATRDVQFYMPVFKMQKEHGNKF